MKTAIVRPGDASERVDCCVVTDVLRATTTAIVLCDRLGALCVVPTPDDLVHLPERERGYALFSELSGVVSDVPRFDNSPVQARDLDLEGRTPVLVTTNGTRAIRLAAEFAGEVVLAGFINLSAVVAYLRASAFASVAFMPAGNINKGKRCIEDDGCADAIRDRIDGTMALDVSEILAACRAEPRILERRANEPNLADDIELCFSLDTTPIVPRVTSARDPRWFDVVRVTT